MDEFCNVTELIVRRRLWLLDGWCGSVWQEWASLNYFISSTVKSRKCSRKRFIFLSTSNDSTILGCLSKQRGWRNRCETFLIRLRLFFVYVTLALLIGCFRIWKEKKKKRVFEGKAKDKKSRPANQRANCIFTRRHVFRTWVPSP